MRERAWNAAVLVASVLWMVAGISMFAILLPGADRPTLAAVLTLLACTALGLLSSTTRIDFRAGPQQLSCRPDAGFHVLAAVVLAPPLAAIMGGAAVLRAVRGASTPLERAFLVSSSALATGTASIAAHAVAGEFPPTGGDVLLAAAAAAAVRAAVSLAGQLLFAESRAPGGAMAVLRGVPVGTILVLEAGLPAMVIGMSAPFLHQPALALLVVTCGQALTWRVMRIQHALFRGGHVTDELLDTFHRYVPGHVARAILDGSKERSSATTGGEQRELTVMFVDIRGFTSWSERTPPGEVLAELNRLLGDLADAILGADGTLDKFTGDGLMAFWNAPSDQPDHAKLAVQTLPKLLMRVREFNIRREVQRLVPLDVGIGVATGPAMVGNIGHRDRLAYTAIGDTVNLAARLEKATAEHDVPALVDERTFLALPLQLQRQFMRLDSIEVKGRAERVRLYAPAALLRHRARTDAA